MWLIWSLLGALLLLTLWLIIMTVPTDVYLQPIKEEQLRIPLSSFARPLKQTWFKPYHRLFLADRPLLHTAEGLYMLESKQTLPQHQILPTMKDTIHSLYGHKTRFSFISHRGHLYTFPSHMSPDINEPLLHHRFYNNLRVWVTRDGQVMVRSKPHGLPYRIAVDAYDAHISPVGVLVVRKALSSETLEWIPFSGTPHHFNHVSFPEGCTLLYTGTECGALTRTTYGIRWIPLVPTTNDLYYEGQAEGPVDALLWHEEKVFSNRHHFWYQGIRRDWHYTQGFIGPLWLFINQNLCRFTGHEHTIYYEEWSPEGQYWLYTCFTETRGTLESLTLYYPQEDEPVLITVWRKENSRERLLLHTPVYHMGYIQLSQEALVTD